MPGQLRIYALLSPSAFAIRVFAWSVPALAEDGADGAATIRAELAAWTEAFNARQADKVCFIDGWLDCHGPLARAGYGHLQAPG
jgi:hypothetical protein